MDFNSWNGKKSYTVGSELEVRIHDKNTLILKEASSKVLPLIPNDIKQHVHQEFLECMLEFVSPVCHNSREVLSYIKQYSSTVSKILKEHNLLLATSGSHSFKIDKLTPVADPRYQKFSDEYGVLLKKFHICGFHIHVGFSNSDEALHVYNYMLDKLPLFLALSANSTFFDGEDSGLLSYRTQLFAQLPRAGIPAYFENYKEMQDVYETLKDSGVVESFSDLWWDIRISPNFGTLEIRICDACNDFDRLEDMINFYQALCFYASTQKVQKLPYQVLVQNKWNAARHGFAGVYHSPNFKRTKIKDYFLILINDMKEKKVFEKLNIEDKYIKRLESRADEKSLAAIQKEVFSDTNSLFEVEKLGILS